MNNQFDICIIGASIAGNYLSYLLSKTALKVAVIEEHQIVGKPLQCAGIISQKLRNLIEIPDDIILNRVKIATLVFPSSRSIEIEAEENPYVIDRVKLDKFFYENVHKKPNIEFFLGEKFKSFEYRKDNENAAQKKVLVTTSRRSISAKVLIGCDGPLSSVARQLNIKNKLIYASQIRIKGQFDEDKAYLYFHPQWNDLFGWIVPEGSHIFRIGLASSSNISKKFRSFLNLVGVNFQDRIDQQGGLIPIGTLSPMVEDNILLLGDAASMVKATTGGGIIMLLIAAKIAYRSILRSFREKNYSKDFFQTHYEKPCKATIGKEMKIHYLVRMMLKLFTLQDYHMIYTFLNSSQIKKLIRVYGDMDFPKTLAFKVILNKNFIKFILLFLLKNPKFILKSLSVLFK